MLSQGMLLAAAARDWAKPACVWALNVTQSWHVPAILGYSPAFR